MKNTYNIYKDELHMNQDILRYIRYLSFKMDVLREQEANPLTIDVGRAQDMFDKLSYEKERKVKRETISILNAAILIASSSSRGSNIAISYLPVAITETIVAMLT